MKNLFILLVVMLSVLSNAENDIDYTKSSYCDLLLCVNDDHIACDNTGFGEACPLIRYLVDMDPLKKLIVHRHNKIRHEAAFGVAFGLRQARKMMKIKWDNELEYMAIFNVRKCVMKKDNCHNTHRFRNSGQNVGYAVGKRDKGFTEERAISNLITKWYDESKNCKQEHIDSYKIIPEQISSYTMMINDQQTHIGCAALIKGLPDGESEALYLCCNYAYTNILGQPVYESGEIGSCCENGTDEKYLGLCEEDTSIAPPPRSLKSSSARNSPLWLNTIFTILLKILLEALLSKFHRMAIILWHINLCFCKEFLPFNMPYLTAYLVTFGDIRKLTSFIY